MVAKMSLNIRVSLYHLHLIKKRMATKIIPPATTTDAPNKLKIVELFKHHPVRLAASPRYI
jgi:hypothetical protein